MGRLFGWVSAVSLLICAAVCGMWIGGIDSERPEDPPLRPMQERLAKPLPELRFDGVEIRDVMNFLREIAFDFRDPNLGLHHLHSPRLPLPPPADLDVDWRSIEGAGVGVHTPVTYSQTWVPLGTVLVDIVNGRGLSCRADATMVHVSSESGFQRAASIERVRFLYTPRGRAVRLALGREMPGDLRGTPVRLDDALLRVGEITGVPIKIDWQQLEKAGHLPDVEIVPSVERTTVGDFLTIVLRDAYGPGALQYEIHDGAIVVGSPSSFEADDAHRAMLRWAVALTTVLGLFAALWAVHRSLHAFRGSPDSRRAVVAMLAGSLACGTFLIMAAMPPDVCDFEFGSRRITFDCGNGMMNLWATPGDPMRPYLTPPAPGVTWPSRRTSERWGFSVVREGWPHESWCVAAPCKPIVLGAAVLPWFWSLLATAHVLRRRQRRRSGRCVQCGYDIRATTGRCPECGNVAAEGPKAMMPEC